jgi:hypothetical protein
MLANMPPCIALCPLVCRWKPPEPVEPWDSYEALNFGAECMQGAVFSQRKIVLRFSNIGLHARHHAGHFV